MESATFLGHLYGTPIPEPMPGKDLVLEIDVQGAAQVHDLAPEAVVVLVRAPSAAVQEERLRARGDDEEHVRRRIEIAEKEEAMAMELASHVIVNDDLDRAVEELASIVALHRADSKPLSPS